MRGDNFDENGKVIPGVKYYNAPEGEILKHNIMLSTTLMGETERYKDYKHRYLVEHKLQRHCALNVQSRKDYV